MTTSSNLLRTGYSKVEQIPVMWVLPKEVTPQCKLVIWLAGGFSKMETVLPILELLALAGYVAVSFDSWERGSRATEEPDVVATRAWANFPLVAFPILGNGALEVLRVVDWAAKEFNLSAPFAVGGRSLGGDIAVAAAELDPRIACVAAIVATPDWKRPGMHVDGVLIGEGQPDAYASYFYNRINPITNPRSYAHCPAILFECGADDELELSQAPELCVEILSPNNSSKEISSKRKLYFERGALEVWTCDLNGTVKFYNPEGELERSVLAIGFPKLVAIEIPES